MSISNLFLQQQMKETDARLQKKLDDEAARQKKGGFWASMGGGAGGLLGGLGAGALAGALGVATGGLAMPLLIGAGAGLGSLGGARIGADLGGGRRHDAVKLGQNVDVLTGKTKEFSQGVKDRYRKNINQFQENLNTNILSQAINTGLKAGAFAYANPMIQNKLGEMGQGLRSKFSDPLTTASGEVLSQGAPANVAGAQAYQPAGLGSSDTLIAPARAIQAPMQGPPALYGPPAPNNLLNMASPPTSSMTGMGPLSNQAFDAASSVSNPLLPESATNILGQYNTQAYGNAMSRANYMRSLGLQLPSGLGG